jgi:hypothetical protein
MDTTWVWESIRNVVESGDENERVDLKEELYNLETRPGKAQLLKHVCGMANALSESRTMAFLVCGVKDLRRRPGNAQLAGYVIGVPSVNRNELTERIGNLIGDCLYPTCNTRYLEIPHPQIDRLLGIIVVGGEDEDWQNRPYVITQSIDDVKQGQIYIRRPHGATKIANRSDIARLVDSSLEQRIEGLEDEVKRLEESLANAEQEYQQEYRKGLDFHVDCYEHDLHRLREQRNAHQTESKRLATELQRFKDLVSDLRREILRSAPDVDWSRICEKLYSYDDLLSEIGFIGNDEMRSS